MMMNIKLTYQHHKSMKIELGKRLPSVKSSHRAEALARGLGFKTNAALVATLGAVLIDVKANNAAFTGYMRDRGFDELPENILSEVITFSSTSLEKVDKIYELLSGWARRPTWYTSHPSDQNRFRNAIDALIGNDLTDIRQEEFRAALQRYADNTLPLLGQPADWTNTLDQFTEMAMAHLESKSAV